MQLVTAIESEYII